jgi:hypothetical protein
MPQTTLKRYYRTKRKRGSKSRRSTRRRRAGPRRRFVARRRHSRRRMRVPPLVNARKSRLVRLRYATTISLNPGHDNAGVGSVCFYQARCASIYDVNFLGVGTQPPGHDMLYTHFKKAVVVGAKATMRPLDNYSNPSNATIAGYYGIHMGPASEGSGFSFRSIMGDRSYSHGVTQSHAYLQYPSSGWGGLLQEDAMRRVGLRYRQKTAVQYTLRDVPKTAVRKYSARKYFGIARGKPLAKVDGLENTSAAGPTYDEQDVDLHEPVFTCWYGAMGPDSPTTKRFQLCFDYIVKYYEPKWNSDD